MSGGQHRIPERAGAACPASLSRTARRRTRVPVAYGLAVALFAAGLALGGSRGPVNDAAERSAGSRPGGLVQVASPPALGGLSVTAVPAASARYTAVDRPCGVVDWTPLTAQVGERRTEPHAQISTVGSVAVVRCSAILGNGSTVGVATAHMTVANDGGTTWSIYESVRRLNASREVLSPVEGLGTTAHAFVEDNARPVIVAVDGNLYLRLTWAPLEEQILPIFAATARALVEIGRQAMLRLRK
ncbi:hypothetical protein [Plantactinospora endophytica]|uniref:DUF3558 domain-containing protein n=1 Tax=Plantactinospora endophytica TaxID=673535 RepID=A0ABQ4DXY0_9ACTN|nr:hypothetical protein [Plantactinospora endophytica]GIG86957.1 hypothetical protein Pen02_18930 [Plantactinospora endophytica]